MTLRSSGWASPKYSLCSAMVHEDSQPVEHHPPLAEGSTGPSASTVLQIDLPPPYPCLPWAPLGGKQVTVGNTAKHPRKAKRASTQHHFGPLPEHQCPELVQGIRKPSMCQ